MPATKARHADSAAELVTPSSATEVTAARIFTSLEPLHGLPSDDVELLYRAAAGLRFIQSMGAYSELEHELFRIALVELGAIDAFVVEAAACYAADFFAFGDPEDQRSVECGDLRRALWFAAILRLSDGFCAPGDEAPDEVYAVWTDEVVYLEFDGDEVSGRRVEHARTRVAALEALTARSVFVASSTARRGAA